jgi:hypothetical protein
VESSCLVWGAPGWTRIANWLKGEYRQNIAIARSASWNPASRRVASTSRRAARGATGARRAGPCGRSRGRRPRAHRTGGADVPGPWDLLEPSHESRLRMSFLVLGGGPGERLHRLEGLPRVLSAHRGNARLVGHLGEEPDLKGGLFGLPAPARG